MDLGKSGRLIYTLRKELNYTQKDVAARLGISAKTVSKWETGRGFPDISLVSELAKILKTDPSKLIEGALSENKKEGGNLKKTRFLICEKCGNIVTETGNAEVICCGRRAEPLTAKSVDEKHNPVIEKTEDEYYITFSHPMSKDHYISFVSYVRYDRLLTVKLYPEQDCALRIPQMRGGKLIFHCNNDGLFELKI